MYQSLTKGALVKHKTTGKLATIEQENITIITHGEFHGVGDIDDTEVAGGVKLVWVSEGPEQGRSTRMKYSIAHRCLEVLENPTNGDSQ